MLEEDFDLTLKCIVVGNGQVGKTSMITRYAHGTFTSQYKKTLGVDFLEKREYMPGVGQEVQYHIWDTAGQEYYDKITQRYYKGASVCIVVFSTVDRDSFNNVEKWIGKVLKECGQIPMVIVQNKTDLMDEAQVSKEEAEKLAHKLNLTLFRTCVKDNINVSQVFQYLAKKFCNQDQKKIDTPVIPIGEVKEVHSSDYKGQNLDVKKNSKPAKSVPDSEQTAVPVSKKKQKKKKNKGGCIIF